MKSVEIQATKSIEVNKSQHNKTCFQIKILKIGISVGNVFFL